MLVVSHVLMAVTLTSFTFLPTFNVILVFRVLLGLFTNTTFYSLGDSSVHSIGYIKVHVVTYVISGAKGASPTSACQSCL